MSVVRWVFITRCQKEVERHSLILNMSPLVQTGDVMGPTLNNLDNLLRLPFGCGEQNMIHFAPNVFVLKYLQKTKQLSHEVESEATDYLVQGNSSHFQSLEGEKASKWAGSFTSLVLSFLIKSIPSDKDPSFCGMISRVYRFDGEVFSHLCSLCFPSITCFLIYIFSSFLSLRLFLCLNISEGQGKLNLVEISIFMFLMYSWTIFPVL